MIDYKCGHTTNGIIIADSNIVTLSAYLDWVETVGLNAECVQCWECYCKESEAFVREKLK